MSRSVELTLVALAFRQLLSRRRIVGVLLFAALPAVLALVAMAAETELAGNARAIVEMYAVLLVPVTLPLCALVFGTGVFGSELEDGTITYVVGKPVARWRIALARIAAASAMTALVVVPATFAAGTVMARGADVGGVVPAFSAAVGAAGVVYCALFVGLSLTLKRALLAGLGYVIIWEGLLTVAFAGARALSVREYTMAMAHALTAPGVFEARLTGGTAAAMAAVVTAAACAYSVRRLRRLEISQPA